MGSLALTERGGRRQGCIDKGMRYEGWSLQKVDKEEGRENYPFEGRAKNVIERGGDILFKSCILILITMLRKSLFIL